MTSRHTHMNTADRLRRGDTITHNGKPVLIADITITDRGQLALLTINPHGATYGYTDAKLLLVDGGTTITFTSGRSDFGVAGHRPSDEPQPTQIRRRGAGFEVYDTLGGEWVYITAAPYVASLGDPAEATEGTLCTLATENVSQYAEAA